MNNHSFADYSFSAHRDPGMNFRIVVDRYVVINRHVGMNAHSCADFDVGAHHRSRADKSAVTGFRAQVDYRGRINSRCEIWSWMKNDKGAGKSEVRIFGAQN